MARLARLWEIKSLRTEQIGVSQEGGDARAMTTPWREECRADLESEAVLQELPHLLDQYLHSCRPSADQGEKRASLFPNLAGFCRWLGHGRNAVEGLQKTHPQVFDFICTVLEDEALNADISASVLTTYLKQRLWHGEKEESLQRVSGGEQLQLIFEHDILEDGS